MTQAIFITGGASGIGRAVALHFAARGWRVGLADVNEAGLSGTAAMLPPGMASTHMFDVRDAAAFEAALEAFVAVSGGRLDVLFNNAGVAVGGTFAETPVEELRRCVEINLMGVVHGARVGYRFLAATPGSCLLNTASAAGLYGVAGVAIYSATKFGVRGLTEALDGEWAPDGIKVRSLMPSYIETPLLDARVTGSNQSVRERVRAEGLEITPVEHVAEAAWRAVHGDAVHTLVGKTAKRAGFAARWLPGALRRRGRQRMKPGG